MRRSACTLLLLLCLLSCWPAPVRIQARAAHWHTARFWTTGYVWTGNRTSSGLWPRAGETVAVDRSLIPFGSRIHIAGVGWRVAEDTGGAIQGFRLDVFEPSLAACYAVTGWHSATWLS